jgi:hypothetical protein
MYHLYTKGAQKGGAGDRRYRRPSRILTMARECGSNSASDASMDRGSCCLIDKIRSRGNRLPIKVRVVEARGRGGAAAYEESK